MIAKAVHRDGQNDYNKLHFVGKRTKIQLQYILIIWGFCVYSHLLTKIDTHGLQSFWTCVEQWNFVSPLGFLHPCSQLRSIRQYSAFLFQLLDRAASGWRGYTGDYLESNMISEHKERMSVSPIWVSSVGSVLLGTELCPGFNPVSWNETLALRGWEPADPLSTTAQGASFVALLQSLFFRKM